MRFTWHDVVATTLVGGAVAVEALHLGGVDLPGLASGRAMTGVVLVLGLGACIAGATTDMASLPVGYTRWMAFLGTGAVVAALAGLITGAFSMVATLTVAVLAMWVATTVRRARDRLPHVTDAALRELIDNHQTDTKC